MNQLKLVENSISITVIMPFTLVAYLKLLSKNNNEELSGKNTLAFDYDYMYIINKNDSCQSITFVLSFEGSRFVKHRQELSSNL